MSDTKGSKPRVFCSRTAPPEGVSRLRQHCDVTVYDRTTYISFEDLKKSVVGADAIYVNPPDPVNKEILDAAGPQLKVVGTASVGLDHIDLEECQRRGVQVGYTPNVLNKAVAEMTVALTLLTTRRLNEALASVCNGEWGKHWNNGLWMAGRQLSDSVIGIVGLGRIGFAAAKRFKSFEPSRIVYCGHSPKPYASEIGAEFLSFKEVLNVSDFVIATCSVNSANKHLFNAETFKEMKSTSVFINISRGALVDQDALYNALTAKQIAAAGLDVTSPEPLPTDHKLLSLSNCTITPHLGSATEEARNAMCNLTVDNILAGLNDKPLPTPAF